ncbi:MAG TPA: hypothetical protein PLR32_06305 [candidate division Zixibacteria bacterium]|nr:hypothetical protein [candidate division Zixibacteria bacterium]MDD4918455.1 hypothetical protein [candidate division Zixibacteria bacterium]MDM7971782.1 hypothetical protein [candidate division Zixibacteria bacterium]HOD66689.1 hypothetical protein [candidate division Zixibacteria bacterium]HOZ09140.1 hypothetical protein [candidate division Zixibacteria bacterium]
MNQESPQQKKGMSTGCLVALIIVGVLVILVVVAGIVCYMKRADLVQYGAVTMTEEIKQMVADKPQPGVDTVQVNAAADAFLAEARAQREPDAEGLALFIQSIQHIRNDGALDSLEAYQFIEAISRAYPNVNLGQAPAAESAPADTMGGEAAPADTAGAAE